MVFQAFEMRLYTSPPQEKRFPEALADFANSLVTITNSLLLRFIAYILGAHVRADRLSLLHGIQSISYKLCAQSNRHQSKAKIIFGYFLLQDRSYNLAAVVF